jgi:hypothetical protein
MWTIYLCGWVTVSVAAFVVTDTFRVHDMSPGHGRAALALVAGALWPVVLIGVVQLVCITGAGRWIRTAEYARR